MITRIRPLSWLLCILLSSLIGCGHRPSQTRPNTTPPMLTPEVAPPIGLAEKALSEKQFQKAKSIADEILKSAPSKPVEHRARYVHAMVLYSADAGRASDALMELLDHIPPGQFKDKVRQSAVRVALEAKRCVSARKALDPVFKTGPLDTKTVDLILEFGQCLSVEELYTALTTLSLPEDAYPKIDAALRPRAVSVPVDSLFSLLDVNASESLRAVMVDLVARRADEITDRRRLERLIRLMDDEHPYRPKIKKKLSQLTIAVILPLSGRARHSGQNLKDSLDKIRQGTEEDQADAEVHLKIFDGGTKDQILDAFKSIAEEQSAFAVIGLFDTQVSLHAAQAAQEYDLPMLMMSHKSAITKGTQGIWRLFPTPLTVTRNLAATALSRGGTKAVVAYADQAYGKRYASWFRRVWAAVPNTTYLKDVKWSDAQPDYARLAEDIAQSECDTLFLPMKPKDAAQLLRHLASMGVWAKGTRPRFADDEGMREITVMGPPEWYDLQPGSMLSHYGNNILVPVLYASETSRGQIFSQRIEEQTGQAPSTSLAVLLDAVKALEAAHMKSMEAGASATETIATIEFRNGATAGFSFGKPEAVTRLFLMTLSDGRFTPVPAKK